MRPAGPLHLGLKNSSRPPPTVGPRPARHYSPSGVGAMPWDPGCSLAQGTATFQKGTGPGTYNFPGTLQWWVWKDWNIQCPPHHRVAPSEPGSHQGWETKGAGATNVHFGHTTREARGHGAIGENWALHCGGSVHIGFQSPYPALSLNSASLRTKGASVGPHAPRENLSAPNTLYSLANPAWKQS